MVRFWNFACLKSGHTYIKFYNPTFIFFFTNFSPDLIFYFNSKFHSYGHTTCQCSQGWKWHFMSKIKGTKKLVSAHLTEPQGHNKKKKHKDKRSVKSRHSSSNHLLPPNHYDFTGDVIHFHVSTYSAKHICPYYVAMSWTG